MFSRKTLSHYEAAILQGKLFLVRNRLVGKYTDWRYYGNTGSSDDAYRAYILAFHATQPHVDASWQRYEYDSRAAYQESTVGNGYYLVLKPYKKNANIVTVQAIFPCDATVLSDPLQAALERDAARTGHPVSLATERKERDAMLANFIKNIEEHRYKNETPEEKEKRLKAKNDQAIFSEITNSVLSKYGCFFLIPLIILGCILLFFMPLLGMACIFGGIILFLVIVLLLLALKKPLVAMKKRRMDIYK